MKRFIAGFPLSTSQTMLMLAMLVVALVPLGMGNALNATAPHPAAAQNPPPATPADPDISVDGCSITVSFVADEAGDHQIGLYTISTGAEVVLEDFTGVNSGETVQLGPLDISALANASPNVANFFGEGYRVFVRTPSDTFSTDVTTPLPDSCAPDGVPVPGKPDTTINTETCVFNVNYYVTDTAVWGFSLTVIGITFITEDSTDPISPTAFASFNYTIDSGTILAAFSNPITLTITQDGNTFHTETLEPFPADCTPDTVPSNPPSNPDITVDGCLLTVTFTPETSDDYTVILIPDSAGTREVEQTFSTTAGIEETFQYDIANDPEPSTDFFWDQIRVTITWGVANVEATFIDPFPEDCAPADANLPSQPIVELDGCELGVNFLATDSGTYTLELSSDGVFFTDSVADASPGDRITFSYEVDENTPTTAFNASFDVRVLENGNTVFTGTAGPFSAGCAEPTNPPSNPIISIDGCTLTASFTATADSSYTIALNSSGNFHTEEQAGVTTGDTVTFTYTPNATTPADAFANPFQLTLLQGTIPVYSNPAGPFDSSCQPSDDPTVDDPAVALNGCTLTVSFVATSGTDVTYTFTLSDAGETQTINQQTDTATEGDTVTFTYTADGSSPVLVFTEQVRVSLSANGTPGFGGLVGPFSGDCFTPDTPPTAPTVTFDGCTLTVAFTATSNNTYQLALVNNVDNTNFHTAEQTGVMVGDSVTFTYTPDTDTPDGAFTTGFQLTILEGGAGVFTGPYGPFEVACDPDDGEDDGGEDDNGGGDTPTQTNPTVTVNTCSLSITFTASPGGTFTLTLSDASGTVYSETQSAAEGEVVTFNYTAVAPTSLTISLSDGTTETFSGSTGAFAATCSSEPIEVGCDSPIPAGSVVGEVLAPSIFYWGPELWMTTSPPISIPTEPRKTLWVVGMDADRELYQVVFACDLLWLPVEVMGPNFDRVWNGTPLPTRIVE
jgi:uncharacterized metal-binding protein